MRTFASLPSREPANSEDIYHPRGRRRPHVFLVLGIVMTLIFATVGIADAQSQELRRGQEEAPRVTRVEERPIQRERPVPVVETLRLACTPDFVGGERGVLCQWSEAKNPATRAYQLFRISDGSARELIATVGVNGRLGFFDTDVTAPSSLIYGVTSVNANGRILGVSAPVHVQYGDQIEQLRMACTPDSIDGQRGVLCRWSESAQREARGYLVYRSVAGEGRELIARIGLDGRNSHFDTDVVPGQRHTYGVVAIDADGVNLAVGGPEHVAWPDAD